MMSTSQAPIFQHATMSPAALSRALALNADGVAYDWRVRYPNLAGLDALEMLRSMMVFHQMCPNNAHDAFLLHQLNMPIDTGMAIVQAALRGIPAAIEDIQQRASNQWFRLSLVHWQAGRDKVHLVPFNPSDVSVEESRLLAASIAPWFIERGWDVHVAAPHEWFVRSTALFDFHAPSLSIASSDQLEHFLPHGKDLARWQTLLTEIQMTWHGHVVNQTRVAENRLLINSVWLDGNSSGRLWTQSALANWQSLNTLVHTHETTDIHAHLNDLNLRFAPFLQQAQDNLRPNILLLGTTWQQTIQMQKRPLLRRLYLKFFPNKKKPLAWLETPSL